MASQKDVVIKYTSDKKNDGGKWQMAMAKATDEDKKIFRS